MFSLTKRNSFTPKFLTSLPNIMNWFLKKKTSHDSKENYALNYSADNFKEIFQSQASTLNSFIWFASV